jgi:hypothetical protein
VTSQCPGVLKSGIVSVRSARWVANDGSDAMWVTHLRAHRPSRIPVVRIQPKRRSIQKHRHRVIDESKLHTFMARPTLTPGALEGMMTIDCCLCGFGFLGSDLPISRCSLVRGSPEPLIHCVREKNKRRPRQESATAEVRVPRTVVCTDPLAPVDDD